MLADAIKKDNSFRNKVGKKKKKFIFGGGAKKEQKVEIKQVEPFGGYQKAFGGNFTNKNTPKNKLSEVSLSLYFEPEDRSQVNSSALMGDNLRRTGNKEAGDRHYSDGDGSYFESDNLEQMEQFVTE